MATGSSKKQWKGNGKHKQALIQGSLGPSAEVSLSYEGKLCAQEILATPPATTRLIWEGLPASPNRLYYGDNLPILAALAHEAAVLGKVKLVYIDPPYATKRVFQSRTQQDAYQDLLEGAHYLEFLRQRLIFLRELLAEDGSIYVNLDENMAFQVKIILDEIFGRANFRNWITRKKCNPKNYTRKTYGNIADYILFYTKSHTYTWNRPMEQWTDERARKEYEYSDEQGRRYKKVPVHAPGTRHGETGLPWRGKLPPPGKHWQYPPRVLDEMDARGEIYWSPNGNPRRKVYLDKSKGVPVQDIWLDCKDAHNQNIQGTGYPTEKNPHMLERIVSASSNEGDLVLDCFAGSGTTLAVAAEQKRRWLGIDHSPEAIAATIRRLVQGTAPIGDFVGKRKARAQKTAPPGHGRDFALYAEAQQSDDLDPICREWLQP